MPGVVRLAIADLSALEDIPPSVVGIGQIDDRSTVLLEEDELVIDLPGLLQLRTQGQLPLQDFQSSRAQHDLPVLASLGAILLSSEHADVRDLNLPFRHITVRDGQRDLFGLSQSREESKLLIVAVRKTELGVRGRNDRFSLLNRERVDLRAILLRDPEGRETRGRIVLLRMILVAELERTAQDAHDIVIGLLGFLSQFSLWLSDRNATSVDGDAYLVAGDARMRCGDALQP